MVIFIVVIGVCVLLLLAGLVAPRFSRWLQGGTDQALSAGSRTASHAPGKLGRWLSKSFAFSRKAADRSAETGREGRRQLP